MPYRFAALLCILLFCSGCITTRMTTSFDPQASPTPRHTWVMGAPIQELDYRMALERNTCRVWREAADGIDVTCLSEIIPPTRDLPDTAVLLEQLHDRGCDAYLEIQLIGLDTALSGGSFRENLFSSDDERRARFQVRLWEPQTGRCIWTGTSQLEGLEIHSFRDFARALAQRTCLELSRRGLLPTQ